MSSRVSNTEWKTCAKISWWSRLNLPRANALGKFRVTGSTSNADHRLQLPTSLIWLDLIARQYNLAWHIWHELIAHQYELIAHQYALGVWYILIKESHPLAISIVRMDLAMVPWGWWLWVNCRDHRTKIRSIFNRLAWKCPWSELWTSGLEDSE